MRPYAAALVAFIAFPVTASADEKVDCISAHEGGQVARREGRFDRARDAFAACQKDECPAVLRSRCAEFARELETAQPTLVVIVRDAQGADIGGARVRIDGAPPVDVTGMGLRLNPGSHALGVERDGFLPAQRTIVLPEGVKNMQAIVSLERPQAASGLPSVEPGVDSTRPNTTAWAFAIGGGVALLAAGGLSGAGWVIHANLQSSCGGTGCSDAQVEPLRIVWPAAFAALGIGVLSEVVAVVLFAKNAREPAPSAWVLTPTGAGVRF